MTQTEAVEAVKLHGSLHKAALALGIGKSTVHRALHGQTRASHKAPVPKPAVGPGRTLAAFKALYDKATVVPKKIKDCLRRIGTTQWRYEVEFAKEAGVSLADIGTFRQQFMEYVVPLKDGRKVWAGSAGLAAEMRKLV